VKTRFDPVNEEWVAKEKWPTVKNHKKKRKRHKNQGRADGFGSKSKKLGGVVEKEKPGRGKGGSKSRDWMSASGASLGGDGQVLPAK